MSNPEATHTKKKIVREQVTILVCSHDRVLVRQPKLYNAAADQLGAPCQWLVNGLVL